MADFTTGEETPLIHSRLFAVCAALVTGACATVSPNLPAVTEAPASLRQEGRIIWHDLLTTTPAESRKFYGELFGWEFERPPNSIGFGNDDSYLLIRHEGRLIGGMLDANILNRETNVSQWISVMSVADIEAAVQGVTANGGEVLTAATDVGSRGWMAVVAGPDRAIIALLQTRMGDPGKVDQMDAILARFDCDLSLDVHDPEMKKSHIDYTPEHHYQFGLSKKQRERISTDNQKLMERHK